MEQEKQIRLLLDKYFDGNSSLEEERRLKAYFSTQEQIPEDIKYARAMFGFFAESSEAVMTQTIETPHTVLPKLNPIKRRFSKRLLYLTASCAAVMALAFIITSKFGWLNDDNVTIYGYINGKPITDVQQAMDYTITAMDQVSGAMELSARSINSIEILKEVIGSESVASMLSESLSEMNNDKVILLPQ